MRRADAPAATARSIGRTSPTWPTSAIPSSKPSPTELSSSPNIPAPAGASTPTSSRSSCSTNSAIRKHYITPDCIADFTTIHLEDIGPDRVRVSGIRGRSAPANAEAFHQLRERLESDRHAGLQLAAGARKSAGGGPHRARSASNRLGLRFEEIYTEFFGVNACHGPAARPCPDPPEVQLRIGVRGRDRKAVDRFTRELIPLVLSGPPGATGLWRGPAGGARDRGLLAGADSARGNPARVEVIG